MNTLLANGLSLLLQSTLLLSLGLLAAHCLRRRGPILQSALCRAALASVALAAFSSTVFAGHVRPLWRVALPAQTPPVAVQAITPPTPAEIPPAPNFGRARVGAGSPRPSPPVPPELGARGSSSPVPPLSGARGPVPFLYPILAALWAMGTLALLFWLLACHVHVSHLRRRSIPVLAGPAADTLGELCAAQSLSPPRLLASGDVQSPFLTGLRHPAIVLPASYQTDFAPDALRAILSHELAHLERRDCAWTLLARLTCAALWMQPLLWPVCRQMEHAAEEACDQAVLARHADPRLYADCLLSLAERLTPSRLERAVGASVVPFRSSLGQRIQHILERKQAMPALSFRLRAALAVATGSVALSALCLVSSSVPAQTAPATPTASSIVGTWRYPTFGTNNGLDYDYATFQADGRFQVDSTHGIPHVYGVYSVTGDKLTITIQRNQWADGVTRAEKSPKPHLSRFTLTADKLIILPTDSHTPTMTAERVTTVGEKPSVAPSEAKADDTLAQARFMAGLTAVQGPGVIVTLNDSKKPFPSGMPSGMAPPNIIHDADINQVVNELKAAGAEAIAVNDQRLVATSPIRCAGPTVYVNNTPQPPPFVIKAIGDPKTLEYVTNQPGGVIAQIRQFDPAMVKSMRAEHLVLPAYTETGQPRYAKPAAGETSSTNTAPALASLITHRNDLAAENARLNEQLKALNLRLKAGKSSAWSKRFEQQLAGISSLQAEIAYTTITLQPLRLHETPQHPDMLAAKTRLATLQTRLARLKIAHDLTFIKELHQSNRQWSDLDAERRRLIQAATGNQIMVNALNARIQALQQANPHQ